MSARGTGAKSSIGTSPVALVGSSTPVAYQVLVKPAAANTLKVYIGLSGVTANAADATDGMELSPTDQPLPIPAAFFGGDLSNLYAVSTNTGQKVFFLYY
jgi:hypothetical protein